MDEVYSEHLLHYVCTRNYGVNRFVNNVASGGLISGLTNLLIGDCCSGPLVLID